MTIDFSLQFKEDGVSEVLGERWRIAVVITALRLQYLHVIGGTNKHMVAIGEVLRGKQNRE
jgi:hypothetical protein